MNVFKISGALKKGSKTPRLSMYVNKMPSFNYLINEFHNFTEGFKTTTD